MKYLDNRFDSVREDQWVTVNKQAADFMLVFSEMLPEQRCADVLVAGEEMREEFGVFKNWGNSCSSLPRKDGLHQNQIGPRNWHLPCKELQESFELEAVINLGAEKYTD